MELLEATSTEIEEQKGETVLSQLLTGVPLTLVEALGYGYQIAGALQRIHENGSFCGNLNPSKIVLAVSGAVTIMLETAGESTGFEISPPYTAPEQWDGKPGDHRIDVFAFGAVLYEMLTGRRAFDAATGEDITAAIGGIEDAGQASDQVRSDVARLVRNCLENDPRKRYSSMRKVLVELKLLLISIKAAEQRRRKSDVVPGADLAGLKERMTFLEETFSATTEQMQGASEAAASVCAALAKLEENITHRLESHEVTADDLHRRVDENGAELQKMRSEVSATLDSATAELRHISSDYNTGLESVRALVGTLDEILSAKIGGLEQELLSQNDSIKLLETSCSQIDDVMERTLETLDGLVEVVPE